MSGLCSPNTILLMLAFWLKSRKLEGAADRGAERMCERWRREHSVFYYGSLPYASCEIQTRWFKTRKTKSKHTQTHIIPSELLKLLWGSQELRKSILCVCFIHVCGLVCVWDWDRESWKSANLLLQTEKTLVSAASWQKINTYIKCSLVYFTFRKVWLSWSQRRSTNNNLTYLKLMYLKLLV